MTVSPTITSLQKVIAAYPYIQFADDDDIRSFFDAYNTYAQSYLDTFNTLNLPIYTQLSGTLLDWVAAGVYGILRPGLPIGGTGAIGPYNSGNAYASGRAYNQYIPAVAPTYIATTDDIFKRVITWTFMKGDGKVFNMRWLKRRVYQFLNGVNGIPLAIDQTYGVSVAFTGPYAATITLATTATSSIFKTAVGVGALELPFQIAWTVVLV